MSLAELDSQVQAVVAEVGALGADEVSVRLVQSTSTELTQRGGQPEKVQESRGLSLRVALLVRDRWSVHGTNDLRPRELRAFLQRAVAATAHLEPDPDRRLAPVDQLGSAVVGPLDLDDPSFQTVDPGDRHERVAALEAAVQRAAAGAPLRSTTTYVWDGRTERAMATSSGFSASWAGTQFGKGATAVLEDAGGRLPEAYSFLSARHAADLPGEELVAADVVERARRRLGSGPAPSGQYPMLLDARAVGRVLQLLLEPLDGSAIHERRSCLADRLAQPVASAAFDLWDDPLLPRGLASQPTDVDGLPARRRKIVEGGVLRSFLLDVHYGRRLGRPPTGGDTTNLVLPPGPRTPQALIADLPRVIRVDGFLGGNSNAASGDFSLGIFGTLLEGGRPVRPVSEMNLSGNLVDLFGGFVEAADDVWTFGSCRAPSLLFQPMQFSGSQG